MPRLTLKRTAIADLKEIANHINEAVPGRGNTFIDEIKETCEHWATFPLAGRERPEVSKGLRSFSHGDYVILYRPRLDGIAVVRIIHGKRDIQRLFS